MHSVLRLSSSRWRYLSSRTQPRHTPPYAVCRSRARYEATLTATWRPSVWPAVLSLEWQLAGDCVSRVQILLITDLVELSDQRTFLADWCQVEGTQSDGWQETNIFRKALLAIELIDRQVELAGIATEDCDPDPRNVSAI